MRIVMLGTGPFAVPTLRRLAESVHEVVLCVSRPPRDRQATASPLQLAAAELNLEAWLPETVNSDEAVARLVAAGADLLVVCDYGEILKRPVLEAAKLGGVNLHGSLLPKYRGAAPVQWAILNGDKETGSTVIQMTPGLDAGPVLGTDRVEIDLYETAAELEARLAERGAILLVSVVDELAAGSANPIAQDKSAATKAPRLTKADGQIEWSRAAREINNQVRALQPWPRAFTEWRQSDAKSLRLIVHQVRILEENAAEQPVEPGKVAVRDGGLFVATGDGVLELVEVQPAGKRRMTGEEFARGYPAADGAQLG